jgi:C-terminal processing protease CtpA/Prc
VCTSWVAQETVLLFRCDRQDPTHAVANTVRSGTAQVDIVWRPSSLSHNAWPDVMAGPLTSKPLVMLVNSNTASASEVLAGAAGFGR